MNDFGRLGVGIVLLVLAIFLSLKLDRNGSAPDPGASDSANDAAASDVLGQPPRWQAPENDSAIPALPANDVARPSFDAPPSARELFGDHPDGQGSMVAPGTLAHGLPQLSDQYRALAPFRVSGSAVQGSSLVPVQPRPGFTGPVPYSRILHTIRPGDTLQTISSEYYGTADLYLEIYLANRHLLANPARLPEGVEIRIPELAAPPTENGGR
jgi:nucleoid-associated protein YgaU